MKPELKKYIVPTVVVIVLFLFIRSCFNSTETNNIPTQSNKFLAYNYAEDFVKQNLKSPSTAEFPKTIEKDNHIKELGNDEYLINSWVDSQNSFGAMIRSKFSCKIIFEGGSVRCEDLVIE